VIPRLVDSRWTVAVAAAVAGLVRLLGLTRPVRADEAGFELVARSWNPSGGSLYGAYFVDRPPSLIAVYKVSDAIGGPLAIRVVGAVACAVLVLLAAWLGRLVADERAARWSAVAAAALATTPAIDLVAVKGEVLALPVLVGAVGLAVGAVRDRATWPAFAAGLLAGLALGLKQNLAGAALFTGVLVVGSALAGRLGRRDFARLTAAALTGFALPVLATVGWALAAGVRLHTLWYAVYGFRTDASAALGDVPTEAPMRRALLLLLLLVVTGIAVVLAAYLAGVRGQWRRDAPLTGAVVAMIGFDVLALAAGGSFWQDYAFGLVPATLLALALLAARWRERLVPLMVASTLIWLVCWGVWNLAGQQEFNEHDTGVALKEVAEPGDTLVVFGGRADVQLESGMPSPYPYLWSLPMRTLDPDLVELRALVTGPDAPTWLVEWWPFDTWTSEGRALEREVKERYVEHDTGCGDRTIWLLKGVDRPVPEPDCSGRPVR
jgi:4-amino-4-deoxy-L-arabinose transferase-like glycosyltransferase